VELAGFQESEKWLHEYHAERRLEGDHIMLSLAASF